MATGLLLYMAAHRAGAPRGLALIPAAVVLLAADQLYLEHALLAETLFTFFVAAVLYATVRAGGVEKRATWAVAGGSCSGSPP